MNEAIKQARIRHFKYYVVVWGTPYHCRSLVRVAALPSA